MLMVILLVVSVPIAFLNELNAIAALVLVRGADFLSVFDKPQRDALAMLFLNLLAADGNRRTDHSHRVCRQSAEGGILLGEASWVCSIGPPASGG
jgi:hypothetical protein